MYSVRNIGKFLDTSDLPAEEKSENNIISFSNIDYVLGEYADQFREHMRIDETQLELTKQDLKKISKINSLLLTKQSLGCFIVYYY